MTFEVIVADERHIKYADEICEEVFISARERGTGIARRTPEYIIEKIIAGKAVIAVAEDGRFSSLLMWQKKWKRSTPGNILPLWFIRP